LESPRPRRPADPARGQEAESRREDGGAEHGAFARGQGGALFARINASGSGWVRQGDFVAALSKWMETAPPAAHRPPGTAPPGAAEKTAPHTPAPVAAPAVATRRDPSAARTAKLGGETRRGPASSSQFAAPSSLAAPLREPPDLRGQVAPRALSRKRAVSAPARSARAPRIWAPPAR
jgi:hypothetical protein